MADQYDEMAARCMAAYMEDKRLGLPDLSDMFAAVIRTAVKAERKEGLFIEIDGVEHGPRITGAVITHVAEVWAENDRLRSALEAAANSLDAISRGAGKRGTLLEAIEQIRGYANSRADAAREALRTLEDAPA